MSLKGHAKAGFLLDHVLCKPLKRALECPALPQPPISPGAAWPCAFQSGPRASHSQPFTLTELPIKFLGPGKCFRAERQPASSKLWLVLEQLMREQGFFLKGKEGRFLNKL